MGSADSTAEQQLHAMEAAQNTFVASHFPDVWSNPHAHGFCEVSMCHRVVKDTGEKLVRR